MYWEPEGRPARGLRRYLGLVAAELGLDGAGHLLQFETPVTAYLPVDVVLPRFPDQDVALVWDEEQGWAVGVETHAGSPIALLSYLATDILPAPRAVARFVDDMAGDRFPGQPVPPNLRSANAPDDLLARLADYAPPVLPFTFSTPVRAS